MCRRGVGYEQQVGLEGAEQINVHVVRRNENFADARRVDLQGQLNDELHKESLMRVTGTGHFNEFSVDELVAGAGVGWRRHGQVVGVGQPGAGFRFGLGHGNRLLVAAAANYTAGRRSSMRR